MDIIGSAVEAVDGQVGTVSAGDGGSFSLYRTITLDAQRAGLPVSASFTVTYSDASLASLEATGTTLDVELLLRTVSTEGDSVMASWTVQAEAIGSPLASLTVDAPTSAPSTLVVVLQVIPMRMSSCRGRSTTSPVTPCSKEATNPCTTSPI